MSRYDHLEREELIRLLKRRDAERQLGLVWERDEIEADAAVNSDYVALTLDPGLSFRGNREPGTGNREPGTGNREPGTGNRAILMHISRVSTTS